MRFTTATINVGLENHRRIAAIPWIIHGSYCFPLPLHYQCVRHLRQLSHVHGPVGVNSCCFFLNYYPFGGTLGSPKPGAGKGPFSLMGNWQRSQAISVFSVDMFKKRWRNQKQFLTRSHASERPPTQLNKNMEHNEMHSRDIESTIVTSVKKRLDTLPDQPVAATIFKVPHTITSGRPEAYKPKFVSIGPFHHNRHFPHWHQTEAAQTHKIWYLRDYLGRDDQPCKFKDYVGGILPLERKARDCYSEEVQLSSHELIEGMVLDACFIIELFLKMDKKDSIAKDPIYGSFLIEHIAHDLLLLENQLPFFILEDVYKNFNKKKSSFKPLTELAMKFFSHFVLRNDAKLPAESVEVHHLLHLVYLHFVSDQPFQQRRRSSNEAQLPTSSHSIKLNYICKCNFFPFQRRSNEAQLPTHQVTIPSATQLHDAGVMFSKGKKTNFLAIEFNNGRLEIPPFVLDDSTDPFMRNLIAFEQCFPQTNRKYSFTLYAYFMDRLVNTENDIKILSKSGIIEHALGSDEEAAVFFNKLCNGLGITFENSQLGGICKQLNEYYRFRQHMSRAKSILSLAAALVRLVLTFIQTLFSVMQDAKPK